MEEGKSWGVWKDQVRTVGRSHREKYIMEMDPTGTDNQEMELGSAVGLEKLAGEVGGRLIDSLEEESGLRVVDLVQRYDSRREKS